MFISPEFEVSIGRGIDKTNSAPFVRSKCHCTIFTRAVKHILPIHKTRYDHE